MRRLLAGAVAGLALLVQASPAGGQDSQWAGSKETTSSRTSSLPVEITATFMHGRYDPRFHSFDHRTWVTTPSGLPSGCQAAGETEVDRPDKGFRPGPVEDSTDTWAKITPRCNGVYSFRVIATIDYGFLGGGVHKSPELNGTIEVAAPPPDVPRANASKEGSGAVVSWSPVSSPPPDFLGYRIERATGDDTWETLDDVGRNGRSFTDSKPVGGGGAAYRVRARRAAPGRDALSGGVVVTVPGDGSSSSSVPGGGGGATDGGADGGADAGADGGGTTDGGGDAGGAADGGASGGGSGGGTTVARSGPQARGRTGNGTRAPRLGQPSQANFPPLLTADDGGFDEEIDYGGRNLAGDEGEGDEELSSLFYEEDTGRGMAVPVATGFVLAAWAFHFRFLAKAARPVPAMVPPLSAAHGRRRRDPFLEPEPDPFYDVVEPDPFHEPIGPAEVDPFDEAFGPPARYVPPAHYRPPSVGERYDPFAPRSS